MYSYRASGMFRLFLFFSRVMNFSPRVEITLLSSNFTVSKAAIGDMQSPGYLILSPPTVNIVLFLSTFPSHMSQTTVL